MFAVLDTYHTHPIKKSRFGDFPCKLVVYQVPNFKVPYHYEKLVRLRFWTPTLRAQPKRVDLGVFRPACLIVRGLVVNGWIFVAGSINVVWQDGLPGPPVAAHWPLAIW